MNAKERALLKWIRMGQKLGGKVRLDLDGNDEDFYFDDFSRMTDKILSKLVKYKEPKKTAKKNYVGLEIECFSKCSDIDLVEAFLTAKLADKVHIGADGSIRPSGGRGKRGYEIRIMDTEQQICKTVEKVLKILKKLNFEVNATCGLHVHLDTRRRDKEDVYEKLLKAQVLLYGLVSRSRLNNQYCRYSTIDSKNEKYRAINYHNYGSTVEVRLHHGTLDVKCIQNWIKLLLRIVNQKKPMWVKTPNGFKKRVGSTPELNKYLVKNYIARAPGVDYDAS